MSATSRNVSMLILSVLILTLLVMIVLGFMLGFSHPLPWVLIVVLTVIPFIHDKIIAKRFVEWKDAYSVGHKDIDLDHKKLLGMINHLQTAVHYQTDEDSIENTLNELIEYTKYHFSREEKIMQDHNYPGLDEHKQEHAQMVDQVTKFIDEYRVDKTRTIDNVLQFLKSWLINHINGSDQKYRPYLKP
ncbi:MAG: bacteriohemerythrin [Gammaproteobacteria bacterium]|nr:bacteriohemerythrin [Gammaproteobacteria bacterium]MDH5735275.1 bacteriohemerythrin [Gammaproteobacteria bacterium]